MDDIPPTGGAQSGVYNEHSFSIEPWSFGGGWYWCPLAYTDRLVYSYASKRARFGGRPPSNVAISKATGLNERTVASALERLRAVGFVVVDTPVHQAEHFFASGGSRPGCHWAETVQFWPCYIRSPNSPLSTSDTMVYSYVRNLRGMDTPPKRLTFAYVASAVCMKDATIPGIFDRLVANQLVNVTPKAWAVASQLADVQRTWFLSKLAAPQDEATGLEDFTPDVSSLKPAVTSGDDAIAPADDSGIMANTELVAHLKQSFDICDFREEEYADIIQKVCRFPEVPRAKWDALTNRFLAILDDRRAKANRPRTPLPKSDRPGTSGRDEAGPLGKMYRPPQGSGTALGRPATTATTNTTEGTP